VRQPIPILLYHSVADTPTGRFGPYTVTRAQFAAHLDRVAEHGYRTVSVQQLVEALRAEEPVPARTAVITVDDGFADFAENGWPELASRGMTATLYATTGTVGGRSTWLAPLGAGHLPMLSRQQLRDLADDGCEIGAHSVNHPQLDCLRRDEAQREVRDSKDELEQLLGRPVTTFAYPHGHHDRHVRQMVVDAGFTSATAVRNALSHHADDPFALARVTVTDRFSPGDIDRLLLGRGAPLAPRRERWRTRGSRVVRRLRYRRAGGHAGQGHTDSAAGSL
jgi:peptidoglycan/xylan/chitin deacetylase (PgdA/CDA1 family)